MIRNRAGSVSTAPHVSGVQLDAAAVNLTRLLARLEQNILSSSADLKTLQRSSHHRERVAANIGHARTLLLQLEHNVPQIRIQSQKKATQGDLAQKRYILRRVSEALAEIEQEANLRGGGMLGTMDDEPEDGEDLLAEVTQNTRQESAKPVASNHDDRSTGTLKRPEHDSKTTPTLSVQESRDPPSEFRNRRTLPSSVSGAAATATSMATASGTSAHSFSQPKDLESDENEVTQALHEADAEHSTLITATLSLAQALKAQSVQFQTTLTGENAKVLDSALRALERNKSGMAAAEQKMGMLRKMSEGRGWLGRMMLYAWIAGLWVVAILLVFVAPKLRF